MPITFVFKTNGRKIAAMPIISKMLIYLFRYRAMSFLGLIPEERKMSGLKENFPLSTILALARLNKR